MHLGDGKLVLEHKSYEMMTIENAIRMIMVSSEVDSKTAFSRLQRIAKDNHITILRASERVLKLSWRSEPKTSPVKPR